MKSKHLFTIEWLLLIVLNVFFFCAVSASFTVESNTAAMVCCSAVYIGVQLLFVAVVALFVRDEYKKCKAGKSFFTGSFSLLKAGMIALNAEWFPLTCILFSSIVDPHSRWMTFTPFVIYVYIAMAFVLAFGLGILWNGVALCRAHRCKKAFGRPKTYLIIGLFMLDFALIVIFNSFVHQTGRVLWPMKAVNVVYVVYCALMGLAFLLSLVMMAINRRKTVTG